MRKTWTARVCQERGTKFWTIEGETNAQKRVLAEVHNVVGEINTLDWESHPPGTAIAEIVAEVNTDARTVRLERIVPKI